MIVQSPLYEDKTREAYKVMKNIDEKDTPFLALALKLKCPIWSNDSDFERQNLVKVYKTSYILKKFLRA
ncbi:PIN domain-containing protein [Pyrococcus abyssi]|uniref:PIN domain-containing protein n=1 Tax=Pyrococcus abyssi TaxID=29292 RepID=UPI00373AE3D1